MMNCKFVTKQKTIYIYTLLGTEGSYAAYLQVCESEALLLSPPLYFHLLLLYPSAHSKSVLTLQITVCA